MQKFTVQKLATAGVVGAAYAALALFGSIFGVTYGPIQCRFSEALCVLPFLFPETAWGLGIGCLIANVFSPYGLLDIVVGSCATFLAALLTARCKKKWLAPLPPVVLILVMMIASLIAGAAWGFLPGFFKARWNTNETLFTLMMNYIAIQLTSFFVAKWEYPFGSNTVGIINPTGKQGWLPNMFSEGYNGDFGWNVLIVLVVTVGMYLYLSKSKHGYEIAVIGDSENTARYAGIRVSRVYVRTMLVSGAICGLAGFIAVSGAAHTISTTVSGGRGFTAIIVAWLAQFNSIVMVIFSFLLIVLQKGAMAIASLYGLSQEVSQMITGIILFFLLGSEFFVNYTVHFRGKKVSK